MAWSTLTSSCIWWPARSLTQSKMITEKPLNSLTKTRMGFCVIRKSSRLVLQSGLTITRWDIARYCIEHSSVKGILIYAAYFTKFFPTQFKFEGNFVSIYIYIRRYKIFAHAVLSCHLQTFFAIWSPVIELQRGEFSVEFQLRTKSRLLSGTGTHYDTRSSLHFATHPLVSAGFDPSWCEGHCVWRIKKRLDTVITASDYGLCQKNSFVCVLYVCTNKQKFEKIFNICRQYSNS